MIFAALAMGMYTRSYAIRIPPLTAAGMHAWSMADGMLGTDGVLVLDQAAVLSLIHNHRPFSVIIPPLPMAEHLARSLVGMFVTYQMALAVHKKLKPKIAFQPLLQVLKQAAYQGGP
jgi:hypothetical protein